MNVRDYETQSGQSPKRTGTLCGSVPECWRLWVRFLLITLYKRLSARLILTLAHTIILIIGTFIAPVSAASGAHGAALQKNNQQAMKEAPA